ncbi:hypothetical protein SAMN00120144_3059 [Hymenobacter roseosalivarius DSM 11622]|uniref:Uncharacterized protein n=1 Tax=Hymenobacter roseosalivarius DSM 11622 TaxID=645990 RepID=A0A1W1W4Y3_9BACT|nr:hypothetical protein [Hymenobacter roseosalivarius]SMC00679.1 hypothetical protein SAMN00120144_3059 [Hymenobacter roseosalivarius DSM 11622]
MINKLKNAATSLLCLFIFHECNEKRIDLVDKKNHPLSVHILDKEKTFLFNYAKEKDGLTGNIGHVFVEKLFNTSDSHNGIYIFRIDASHTHERFFIKDKENIIIFNSIYFNDLLKEYSYYADTAKSVSLDNKISYLKSICTYLEETNN